MKIPPYRDWPLWLAILPSLLLYFIPIYEGDVMAIMALPSYYSIRLWLSMGRPVLYFLMNPLMAFGNLIGPFAMSYVMATIYIITFAGVLFQVRRVLALVMPWRVATVTVAIIGLHFHMYEVRTWPGNNALLAILVVTPVFLHLWNSQRTPRAVFAWILAAAFLALNIHQTGAFFVAVWLGLLLIHAIYGKDSFGVSRFKTYWLPLASGFAGACILYGLEIYLIRRGLGFIKRGSSTSLAESLQAYLQTFADWAFNPVPVPRPLVNFPRLGHVFTPTTTAVLAGLAALLIALFVKRVPRPGLALLAVVMVFLVSIGALAPVLFSDGSMTSRILFGPLVALWGGAALILSQFQWRHPRTLRLATSAAILVIALIHTGGFYLTLRNKHIPVTGAEQIRSGLLWNWYKPGDTIIFLADETEMKSIGWSDAGYNLYSFIWGVRGQLCHILRPMGFPGVPSMEYRMNDVDYGTTVCGDRLVCRRDSDTILIQGKVFAREQQNIEQALWKGIARAFKE